MKSGLSMSTVRKKRVCQFQRNDWRIDVGVGGPVQRKNPTISSVSCRFTCRGDSRIARNVPVIAAPKTEGPAPKFPRHCEEGKARRGNPFSFRPRRGRAAHCAAGVTDCHVASLLAMTEVNGGLVLLIYTGGHRGVSRCLWHRRAIRESPLPIVPPHLCANQDTFSAK